MKLRSLIPFTRPKVEVIEPIPDDYTIEIGHDRLGDTCLFVYRKGKLMKTFHTSYSYKKYEDKAMKEAKAFIQRMKKCDLDLSN